MSNEFSTEAIFAIGTGIASKSRESFNVDTTERRDVDDDVTIKNLQSAEALVDFIDTFERLDSKNTSEKMKMITRINSNYGRCNRGIESFCYAQSLEADAEKAEAVADATADPRAKAIVAKTAAKKGGFFRNIFAAIGKFFKTIWEFLVRIVSKFGAWVKKVFSKKQKGDTTPEASSDAKLAAEADTKPVSGGAYATGSAKGAKLDSNVSIRLDFRKPVNSANFDKYVGQYKKFAGSVVSLKKYSDTKIAAAKNASDKAQVENEIVKTSILPVVEASKKLYQVPGFAVNFQIAPNVKTDFKSVKAALDSAKNNVKFDSTGSNDSSYKVIEYMLGLKKGDVKTQSYNKADAAALMDNFGKLSDVVNKKMSELKEPHDVLVKLSDEITKTITSAYQKDTAVVNERTATYACLAGAMKIACQVEQSIGKIMNLAFKSASDTMAMNGRSILKA